jgi:hypothetical protein
MKLFSNNENGKGKKTLNEPDRGLTRLLKEPIVRLVLARR